MTYDEAMEWLHSRLRFGMKLGLENMRALCAGLGNPEQALRFIHVAGTNGKGSVCAMIESILRAEGNRTGLFTSPHLVEFRERVRVNGGLPPEQEVAAALTRIRDATQNWAHSPSYFEVSTALAFLLFLRASCDVVVLETGMGGRLDSTNVVTPLASVITPIGMDHAAHLGDTLEKIACEKAGIIKPGIPVVSSRQEKEAEAVLRATAGRTQSAIEFATEPFTAVTLPLAGSFQKRNAAAAVAAIRAAGIPVSRGAITSGLENVCWPGRFQRIGERLVLDGAHNPPGAEQLVTTWREVFGNRKPTILFSAVVEKDHLGILKPLKALSEDFVIVPMKVEKGEALDELLAEARTAGLSPRTAASVEAGLELTRERLTLATGSLFLVGEILESLPNGGDLFPHIHSFED